MELRHEPETGAVDGPRLARLLGTPDLAWLVERARRRLVSGLPLTGSVSLGDPTPAQRAAVERLLARAPGGGRSLTVRLDAVDAVLRRSGASPDGLAAAVEALIGPVTPLAQARYEEEAAWERAHAPSKSSPRRFPRWRPGPPGYGPTASRDAWAEPPTPRTACLPGRAPLCLRFPPIRPSRFPPSPPRSSARPTPLTTAHRWPRSPSPGPAR